MNSRRIGAFLLCLMLALTGTMWQMTAIAFAETGDDEPEEIVLPQTKVFTQAGPFMPPVKVKSAPKKLLGANGTNGTPDDNGFEQSKTVVKNSDGTYTIRMESYATGEVSTSTSTVPVDIVLVLDQSGSMAYDFNGDSTNINSNRRQYAMKQAVSSFINQVGQKYDAAASDHRISVVTFANSASTLAGWTNADATGVSSLEGLIAGLPDQPSGGTMIGSGMASAASLMGSGYSYGGSNTTRQKVVVVFTDGVPGSSGLDVGEANTAITYAKSLKDAGTTVYSVGIFTGADKEQMYGDREFFASLGMTFSDEFLHVRDVYSYSDGSIGSTWEIRNGAFARDYDVPPDQTPAGNRFLNLLSSNFENATALGLSYDSSVIHYIALGLYRYSKFQITQNYTRTNSSYYLTADDSASLNNIFQSISSQIETADIQLGTDTIVRDVVTPYFTIPNGASSVTVKTADYNGSSFGNETLRPDLTPSISGNTVNVTGFDFAGNFVTDTRKADGTYGKKLIVEIRVTPASGFAGGNDVPTNTTDSGVFAPNENDPGRLDEVEKFDVPKANVPIKDFTLSGEDIHIYKGMPFTDDDVKGQVSLSLNANDFLTLTKGATDNGDGTYTVTVTLAPKTNGVSSAGTPVTGKSNTCTVNLFEYEPNITFKDSDIYLGETVPTDFASNRVSDVTWKCTANSKYDTEVTMLGGMTAPTITYTYTPAVTGTVEIPDDIGVDVAAVGTSGGYSADYSSYVKHQDCEQGEQTDGHDFLLHVKYCTLTIIKSGSSTADAGQSFIFNAKSNNGKVDVDTVVNGNGSVTVTGLPVGTYTVTEDTHWSWRYTPGSASQTVTLNSGQGSSQTVSFVNNRTNGKWLSGDNYRRNLFDGSSSGN